MTTELVPSFKCNLNCTYCYQNPIRDAGNFGSYDMEKMKRALREVNQVFTMFGGEALLVPLDDLKELWAVGLEIWEKNGRSRGTVNSLQTNGVLITDAHIEAFKEFNVGVGVSIDGPGALNDCRWKGSVEKTREATEKSLSAIEKLCEQGVRLSVICTLHRKNGLPEQREVLKRWFQSLETIGVRNIRLHLLEVDHNLVSENLELTVEESLELLLDLYDWSSNLKSLTIQEFKEKELLLLGKDQTVTCTWNACDPLTTIAVNGINGQGYKENCGRVYKDGVPYLKGDTPGYERQLSLYNTPREFGGCKGCRFWVMCKGYCPGTAEDSDWRNRTDKCEVLIGLFEKVEGDLINDRRLLTSLKRL